MRRLDTSFTFADALKVGSSPIPSWLSFVLAVFATVSAFDDVRLHLQTAPDGVIPWWGLCISLAYWAVWITLAFRPQFTVVAFVLMLVVLFLNTEPGGALLLTFAAVAVASYRVSIRGTTMIIGSFLLWQITWVLFVSDLGPAQLWGFIPGEVGS